VFSPRYEAALALAARRHDGQRRKGGELPYLTHLVHVGRLLEPYGEDAVIAGLLHDVLEDTCKSNEEVESLSRSIESSFGAPVLDAVVAVSEVKRETDGTKIS
jgi:(p)ppGpp synthase/HD superfamily hydrolase